MFGDALDSVDNVEELNPEESKYFVLSKCKILKVTFWKKKELQVELGYELLADVYGYSSEICIINT